MLILAPEERDREYKHISIVTVCDFVWFSEDCKHSTAFRPGLKINKADNLDLNQVGKRETIEEWFKDIEEQEITLV
jgi:hypothetical protein